jgi:lon-related putative ATP-dependent protease
MDRAVETIAANPEVSRALAPGELCRRCEPERFDFVTTDDLADFTDALGQGRAVEAIRFGIGLRRDGFNVFAMGPEGLGRHTLVRKLLEQLAPGQAMPDDWCYVFNFETPHKPLALRLPPGRAPRLGQDMARLVEDLRAGIPAAFEAEGYRTRVQEIETEFNERQSKAIGGIGDRARAQRIALLRTPAGFGFAPIAQGKEDEVMEPEEFAKLPEPHKQEFRERIAALQEELESALHEMPKWRREAQRKVRELNRQVTRALVNSLMDEIKTEYRALPEVLAHLTAVGNDVLDHAEFFQQPKEGEQPTLFGIPISRLQEGESPLKRYEVNVLIEHSDARGAPVMYEDNPSHDNLVGRIEHVAKMGNLVTDFTLIKAGALHRANGGYLVLDALKVLSQPFAWEALKRALHSREVRAESLGQMLSLVSTVSLEPQPIPLDVKVVLVGQRILYYLLHAYDPEFGELFKVVADFEDDMARDAGADLLYARVIATMARSNKLRPLDRGAVARAIEHGARAAGDTEKLSMRMRDLVDLLREADHLAETGGRGVVTAEDVQGAIRRREQRESRVRERLQEEVVRGTVLLDTSGERTGQVNGLSVAKLGGFSFGMPHRITARVGPGGGKVVDIEREAELGGPIHSKGVLILSGYLAGRYAAKTPLSLAASLVFEQSYGGVEGDSASSAELYALLSALADAPIRQSFAVTGSVNQHGDVQAIGGVNEKIEGFFDVCAARGLEGGQGVLIPASNVKHLMLKREVVDAVAAGKFDVYPVASVDEGIEILTGVPAGRRDELGRFPENSLNGRVERRLAEFAERVRAFAGAAPGGKPLPRRKRR